MLPRRTPFYFATLLAAVLFTGCSSAPTPVGTWIGPLTSGKMTVPSAWLLRPDGTLTMTIQLPQGLLSEDGTYTVDGNTLTQTVTTRTVILAGQRETATLEAPQKTTRAFYLSGDTLTLDRPDYHEHITLKRKVEP